MEDGVHEGLLVKRVEQGASDVAYALGDNPYNGSRRHAVNKGFEGYQHAESHADQTEGLDVGVLL